MPDISLIVRIAAEPERVFRALATLEGIAGWFTEATSRDYTEGGKMSLNFGEGQTDFDVASMNPNRKLVWRCISRENIWSDTEIRFTLEPKAGATPPTTLVRFDHAGWTETTDSLRECAMSWAYFLESLKLYLETGTGTPESVAPPCDLETD